MSWGGEPVRRDQQGKSIVRMRGIYPIARKKASGKKQRRQRPPGAGPISPALKPLTRRDPECLKESLRRFYSLCAV
jgi:hypothetical protein